MAASGGNVDLPRDAVVVRFRPTQPASVLASAGKLFKETGRFLLSVWADVAQDGENDDEVVHRLLRAAFADNIDPTTNRNCWVCARASILLDLKLQFVKDDELDKPEHYSIDLGTTPPDIKLIETILDKFEQRPTLK